MKKENIFRESSCKQNSLDELVQSLEEYKRNLARLTKEINKTSLFIIYRSALGGSPEFVKLRTPNEILKRARQISGIFGRDGQINCKSKHIENYALCLVHLGHFKKAKRLFDAIYDCWKTITIKPKNLSDLSEEPFFRTISRKSKNFLFLHSKRAVSIYQSEVTADRPGQLGYEGIYQYAIVCLKLGEEERAKELFSEIVAKISADCPPDRLLRIRVETIEYLMAIGTNHVGEIILVEELKKAKFYRY